MSDLSQKLQIRPHKRINEQTTWKSKVMSSFLISPFACSLFSSSSISSVLACRFFIFFSYSLLKYVVFRLIKEWRRRRKFCGCHKRYDVDCNVTREIITLFERCINIKDMSCQIIYLIEKFQRSQKNARLCLSCDSTESTELL